jgi:hypothetical protein
VVFALVAALLGGGFWYYQSHQNIASPTSEQITLAGHDGCYGATCNGKNPSDYCTDGRTVAAMGVYGGMLELRYSRSCKANWARYTPYRRELESLYPRVTVWNPGGTSYKLAHLSMGFNGSSWTEMTDGTKTACTGVEIVVIHQSGNDHKIEETYPDAQYDVNGEDDSQGWTWGPCR